MKRQPPTESNDNDPNTSIAAESIALVLSSKIFFTLVKCFITYATSNWLSWDLAGIWDIQTDVNRAGRQMGQF